MPNEDYQSADWFDASLSRQTALQVLNGRPVGAFVVRPSSQAFALALSHMQGDNTVAHGIVHRWPKPGVASHRRGWSIESDLKTFSTLQALLNSLPLLHDKKAELAATGASEHYNYVPGESKRETTTTTTNPSATKLATTTQQPSGPSMASATMSTFSSTSSSSVLSVPIDAEEALDLAAALFDDLEEVIFISISIFFLNRFPKESCPFMLKSLSI